MNDDQDEIDGTLSKLLRSANVSSISSLSVKPRNDPNYSFEPHRLCSVCSRIIAKSEVLELIANDEYPEESSSEIWPHHKSEAELKDSISRGCHLCHLLYAQTGLAIAKYTEITNEGLPDGQLQLCIARIGNAKVRHPKGYPRFHFEFGLGKPNQTDGKVRPHEPLLLTRELPGPDTPYDSFLTASTGSDAAFATLNNWMRRCLRDHKCCSNQGEFPVYLPKRLLEISGTLDDMKIKLVETGGRRKPEIKYLTLSHCWGTHVPLRLQQENYISFLEKIEYDKLPKLFQDAVQITMRLGFEHLWIDAMCIIQDHDSDWDEALRMSEVFGNSACTISALAATDSTGSCVHDRFPLTFLPCRIETANGGVIDLVSWRARELLKFEGPTSSKSPLHQRAWVMQERYLSARQVHFGQNQLWWQCCEVSLSEIDPNATKPLPFLRAELRRSTRSLRQIEKPVFIDGAFWKGKMILRGKDTTMDWHSSFWSLMTFWFTPGKLSRDEDRYPAVSGIAKMIEVITGSRLVAGMWVSHLMFDMLWQSRYANTNRHIDNGQPSWSWLSVTSKILQPPVYWPDTVPLDKRFTAEILELPDLTAEPFGATLPYYYLPSKPLSLLIRAPMMRFPDIPKGKKLEDEHDASWQDIKAAEPFSKVLGRFLIRGYSCWTPDCPISSEELSDAWVLQWTRHEDASRVHRNHQIDHQLRISGLIVKPLDHEQTRWRRIGRFGFSYSVRRGKPIGDLKTIRLY